MKNRKFVTLYETVYNRFKQGAGFLEGDVVKLKDSYKSSEGYKNLADSVKQRLEDASKSGYNLRLGRLHTPANSAGALGINVGLPATHADIYEEKTPGNFGNLVTIPIDLLEVIDTGVNLPPVSAKNKGVKSEAPYQKPGKWSSNKDTPETKDQNHMGHKQNWAPKGDYELAEKDKKSSVGANKYNDNKPSKFKPLPKNKTTIRETVESLENAYLRVINEDYDMEDTEEIITPSDVERDNDIETENMSVSAPDLASESEEELIPGQIYGGELLVVDYGMGDQVKDTNAWYRYNGVDKPLTLIKRNDKPYGEDEEMAEDTEPGLAQGSNIVAPEEREQTSALESKNHMGEREFQTYSAWKRACKLMKPDAHFTGDKDIDGCEVGEWDGAVGVIYNKPSKAGSAQ